MITSGCLRFYTIEHYDILPKQKNYYSEKTNDSIQIIPYFDTHTIKSIDIDEYQYKNNYYFTIRLNDQIKNRELKEIKDFYVKLIVNDNILISDTNSKKTILQKTSYEDEFYWSYGYISDLKWDDIDSIMVKVTFTAVFQENGNVYEKYIEREIPFTTVFRSEITNKLIDNFRSV